MNKLKQKGAYVIVEKNLFVLKSRMRFTLEEAIDYALGDKKTKHVIIPKERYLELVEDLEAYKANEYGMSKKINIKYGFDKEDIARFSFQIFIDRLYERGFNFMSDKKIRTKLNK